MAAEEPPTFAASVGVELPPGYEEPARPLMRRPPSSGPSLTEHVYTLGGTDKKQPWAFLKVNSRAGKGTNIPLFFQGDSVKGAVELDLQGTEHIEKVTLELRGETWAGDVWTPEGESITLPFWSQKTTVWSMSMCDSGSNDPRNGSPKLKGKHVWPFSITFPEIVMVSSVPKGPVSAYPLPPSFRERNSLVCLDYKLIVNFGRGRLRVDNTLYTPFAFLPRSRPPPSSTLRQVAYRENWSPLGPQGDPEGWEDLVAKSVVGTLFDSRKVEVACLLALAKPLCYSRGTSIPFALTLSCSDSQALSLFTARGSLSIRLMRALCIGPGATGKGKTKGLEDTTVTCVGRGVYWVSSEDSLHSETRKLEGEIPVKGDLTPSFRFPKIVVKYEVSFSLTAPGFVLQSGDAALTFSREVSITTHCAPGPAHHSRVPPGYDEKDSEADIPCYVA